MIITPSMEKLVKAMQRHACSGDMYYDGRHVETPYFRQAHRTHEKTGTSLLFTRDKGMHSSGWFKNPDYDACYHLSISFWDFAEPQKPKPEIYDHALARVWVRLFYPAWGRYVWEEGSALDNLRSEVRHYRVMCNARWQPIMPRKEVYTREFIEKGWKSFSDQQGDRLEIVNKLIDRAD
jgi:hypothetical protein